MAKFHEKTQNIFTLLMGPGYSRKTTWAGSASEAGFNVIIADTDGKTNILRHLPEEAQRRIDVIDIKDTADRDVAIIFMGLISRGKPFIWDEQDKHTVHGNLNPEHSHYVIYPKLMTQNDIFVLDNYTDICYSVFSRWCRENGVDLTKAQVAKEEGQEHYAYCGSVLMRIINSLKNLNKNVIVIAHTTWYEKQKEKVVGGKKQRVTVSTREQIISSSGMHAPKIPPKFQDTLRFEIVSDKVVKIHTAPAPDKEGGSVNIPPLTLTWDEHGCKLPFAKFAELARMTPIDPEQGEGSPAFKYFPAGTSEEEIMAYYESIQTVTSLPVRKPQTPVQGGDVSSAKMTGLLAKASKQEQ